MILSDLCEAIVDCEHKTAPTINDSEYAVIRTPDIGKGRLIIEQARKITAETYEMWARRATPQPGDLIFAREAPVGNVAIVLEGQKVCLGQRTVLLRPIRTKVSPEYLCYYLLSEETQGRLLAKAAGATVLHVNMADIRVLDVPFLPSLENQVKAASVITAYDDLIAANQRRIQLLEESARLLYREWFVKLRFPGHETVPVADGVPDGWEKKTLGDTCDDTRNAADPKELPIGTPYLSMEHMPQRSLSLNEWDFADKVGSTKLKFVTDDILFGKIRPYFHKVGIAPINGITSTDVIVIRARKPEYLPLVALTVSSDDFIAFAVTTSNGTKMPRANWNVLKKRQILLPSQQIIASSADLFLPIIDQIRSIGLHNKTLQHARDMLLPKLMSGALDISRITVPKEGEI